VKGLKLGHGQVELKKDVHHLWPDNRTNTLHCREDGLQRRLQLVLPAGPLFLQQVQGYGPYDTGLILASQGLGAAIVMPAAGLLTDG